MMRQYELVERVTRYNPNADENLLNKAYVYAMQKHGTQQRANGDPYFSHPLEVAGILTDLKLDDATIAVALLHDTIEDTDATRAEIDQMFGEDIGRLVEGLTKISKLDLVSKKAAQAENLRKLLLAISADIRVLLVKLADRLHNMRTLQHMPEEARGPHRRGDARDLRAARRPHGHARHARGAGGAGLPHGQPGSPCHHRRPPCGTARPATTRLIARHREGSSPSASPRRHQRRGHRPREAALFDLPQDGAEGGELRAALRHPRLPRHRRHGRRMLRRGRHRPHHLAGGARALQGLHLDAEAERLPLDPHHGDRPGQPARRAADPHRRHAPHRRVRHRRARPLQGRRGPAEGEGATANGNGHGARNGAAKAAASTASTTRSAPTNGCAAPSRCSPRATRRRSSSSTPSSSCSRTRCSASRRRAG